MNNQELYEKHLMCHGCNRKTKGPEDFKNKQTGKLTKTCSKCRDSVLKCLAKKPQKPPLTMKLKIDIMKKVILQQGSLDALYEIEPRLKEILK